MDIEKIILFVLSVFLIIEGMVRINAKWNSKFTKWWYQSAWGLFVKTSPTYQKKSTKYGIFLILLGVAILLLKVF